MEKLRFVVIGVSGYAAAHLEAVQWLHEQDLAELVGLVALKTEQEKHPELIESLKRKHVTIYSDIDQFFATHKGRADVLTIPIGIHLHVPVSIAALEAGMHVYCEKPLAATIQEVDKLLSARKRTGGKIVVGFQHIYSFSIQQLKARICDGRLGPVQEISMMCGWPRSTQYYTRNDWAGRMRKDDNWILDSPANNAHSHYLLNMLYLCSPEPAEAAIPKTVQSELYRANRIEGPDTVQIRFDTNEGVTGNAIFSHCNAFENGPRMQVTCKNGQVEWQGNIGKTLVKLHDGTEEEFDNLIQEQWQYEGFKDFVQAVNSDRTPICTPEMARCHTLTVNAYHESCPQIKQIPEDNIIELEDWEMFPPDTKGNFRRVKEMDAYLQEAFSQKKFLSELGIPWARDVEAKLFKLDNYDCFPQSDSLK